MRAGGKRRYPWSCQGWPRKLAAIIGERDIGMDWQGYVIAGLIVAFALRQLTPLVGARRARGRAVPELAVVLNEGQRRQSRLLVYFHSPRCGMCSAMAPAVQALAAGRNDVVQIDITEQPALARAFGVMATPSFAMVRQGVIVRLHVGAKSAAQLEALLKP
jgi:thioredoxin 1